MLNILRKEWKFFCLQITVSSDPNLISEVPTTFATFFPFEAQLIN